MEQTELWGLSNIEYDSDGQPGCLISQAELRLWFKQFRIRLPLSLAQWQQITGIDEEILAAWEQGHCGLEPVAVKLILNGAEALLTAKGGRQ